MNDGLMIGGERTTCFVGEKVAGVQNRPSSRSGMEEEALSLLLYPYLCQSEV